MTLQKNKPLRSKKLRDSARGEECTMNSILCNFDPETVVLCHSNSHKHGKGLSIKADDRESFYGCSRCNYWFDDVAASKEVKEAMYEKAKEITHGRMRAKGLGHILDKGAT